MKPTLTPSIVMSFVAGISGCPALLPTVRVTLPPRLGKAGRLIVMPAAASSRRFSIAVSEL